MNNITGFARKRVADLSAYSTEPSPVKTILDANELSSPLPEDFYATIKAAIKNISFNRYPDPEAIELRTAIAEKEGVDPKQIVLGNGSDELIQSLIATVCDPDDKIVIPSPTFSMYKQIAQFLNVDTVEDELDDGWEINPNSMLTTIDEVDPRIIFIASPNNPTGALANRDTLAVMINSVTGLVAVDEAYVDYAEYPVGALFLDRPNVVILRSLSKIGFAGLRLGYMMADADIIEQVNKVRLPYNINNITQAVCVEVMKNFDKLHSVFDAVKKERRRLFDALSSIEKIKPFESSANFILMRIDSDPEQVFTKLLANGIRVRWFKGVRRLDNCFRVTIGTAPENNLFIKTITNAL